MVSAFAFRDRAYYSFNKAFQSINITIDQCFPQIFACIYRIHVGMGRHNEVAQLNVAIDRRNRNVKRQRDAKQNAMELEDSDHDRSVH